MVRIDPDTGDGTAQLRRRRRLRLLVPVGVAVVAAATVGLVPALANAGNHPNHPDLPKITAEQLLAKMAKSNVQTVSGSVHVSTDLGLPSFLGGGAQGAGGSPFGPAPGRGKGGGSSADPQSRLTELASGSHTLRVAADGPQRQKVSIVEDASEYSVIHNGQDVWGYDSAANEVYHAKADRAQKSGEPDLSKQLPATPGDLAKQALKSLDPTTSVTVDGTTEVAGQDAYRLLLKPRQSSSTVGSIAIAVDADNGAPLKFTLSPQGGGKAAVDVGYTDVSFAKPAAKDFAFTPPKGAEVTEAKKHAGSSAHRQGAPLDASDFAVTGRGWSSVVQVKLPAGTLNGRAFKGGAGDAAKGFNPQAVLKSMGDRVNGSFGSGTVIHSRLINALVTDDGKVYAGAVSKDALIAAADK